MKIRWISSTKTKLRKPYCIFSALTVKQYKNVTNIFFTKTSNNSALFPEKNALISIMDGKAILYADSSTEGQRLTTREGRLIKQGSLPQFLHQERIVTTCTKCRLSRLSHPAQGHTKGIYSMLRRHPLTPNTQWDLLKTDQAKWRTMHLH